MMVGGARPPGPPSERELNGMVVVSGKKLKKNSDKRRLWFIESTYGHVIDFTTVFNTPWRTQTGI